MYQCPGIETLEPRQSASVLSTFDEVTGTLYLTDSTVGSISVNGYAAPYASTVQKIVIQVQTGMGENDISLDINGNLYPRLREIDVTDSAGNDGYGSGYGGYGYLGGTPKPGSLVLAALGAGGLALGAWRKHAAKRRLGA
jgi:hypothetical protein